MRAEIRIAPSPDPSVSLLSFGTPDFEAVSTRLGVKGHPLLPFCIVVRNHMDQPITALAVQYKLTNTQRTEVENIVSDGFNIPSHPSVVGPKSDTIAGPGLIISSITSPSRRALRSGELTANLLARLRTMRDIEVSLDAALFANGVLVGRDESQAIRSLIVRQQVAAELGSTVKRMMENADSPLPWLEKLQSQRAGPGDWVRLWQGNYSEMLRRAFERGTIAAFADQLSKARQIVVVGKEEEKWKRSW